MPVRCDRHEFEDAIKVEIGDAERSRTAQRQARRFLASFVDHGDQLAFGFDDTIAHAGAEVISMYFRRKGGSKGAQGVSFATMQHRQAVPCDTDDPIRTIVAQPAEEVMPRCG